jgi:hypothetical protein
MSLSPTLQGTKHEDQDQKDETAKLFKEHTKCVSKLLRQQNERSQKLKVIYKYHIDQVKAKLRSDKE